MRASAQSKSQAWSGPQPSWPSEPWPSAYLWVYPVGNDQGRTCHHPPISPGVSLHHHLQSGHDVLSLHLLLGVSVHQVVDRQHADRQAHQEDCSFRHGWTGSLRSLCGLHRPQENQLSTRRGCDLRGFGVHHHRHLHHHEQPQEEQKQWPRPIQLRILGLQATLLLHLLRGCRPRRTHLLRLRGHRVQSTGGVHNSNLGHSVHVVLLAGFQEVQNGCGEDRQAKWCLSRMIDAYQSKVNWVFRSTKYTKTVNFESFRSFGRG